MSAINNRNVSEGPISPPASSPASNPASTRHAAAGAEAPLVNQTKAPAAPAAGGLLDNIAQTPGRDSASERAAAPEPVEHRPPTGTSGAPSAHRPPVEPTEREFGRPAGSTGSSTVTPATSSGTEREIAGAPAAPGNQPVSQPNRTAPEAQTQAGGALPPAAPPASAVASSAEEPKPGDGTPPPPFDIEEFIRDAEDRKRGAKTMREIKALGSQIKELIHRGIPLGPIYEGLKRRGLVSCSRSRFGEICAELFPDVIGPPRHRNA